MDIQYATALLRYCNDLTDPDAVNMPVASFLVAKTDDSYFAAAAGFTQSFFKKFFDESQTLSESMLEDIPQLIKRHINEAFSDQSEAAPDIRDILIDLERALRNTLNVSEISPVVTESMSEEQTGAVSSFLLGHATSCLIEKTRETLEQTLGVRAERRGRILNLFRSQPEQSTTEAEISSSSMEEPMQNFWPISQPAQQRMRA